MENKNAFKEKPVTISHISLKEQGVKVDVIIGSKLLKIKVKDFMPQDSPINNTNIRHASVLCLCSCSNYCIFPVATLIQPDVLPSCSDCQNQIEAFMAEEAKQGRELSLEQAWECQGIVRDEMQYSRVFLDFADRSNCYHYIDQKDNMKVSTAELELYKIKLRHLCSALRGKNTRWSTPNHPKYNFHCLCNKFLILGLDVLRTFEPIGVCSTCAHELRYSLQQPEIHAKTQKLELKRMWQKFLKDHHYPNLSFKTTWELYLTERRALRKAYIELHFKDFLANEKYIKLPKTIHHSMLTD